MKVLVTGATGFVGQVLVEKLIHDGHDVVVLSRNAERATKKIGLPVTAYDWDLMETQPPAEAFAGVKGVVHLAGESVAEGRWTAKQKKKILETRTKGTDHLVAGIKAHGSSVKAFVCASAIGIYGDRADEKLDETSTPGDGFLADVCKAWEAAAAKAAPEVRTTSLRIGMVLGRGGALSKLLPIFKLGLGGPVGNGKQWVSWIHVEDVARLIIHSLKTESVKGAVNAVAPNPVTNKAFTKSLAGALGVPAFLPAPTFVLKIALGQMSELAIKSQRINPTLALQSGFTFTYPDIDSATREICPDPKKKNEELLKVHQWLEQPVGDVFPFFSDARNLEKITPTWLNFQVISDVDDKISAGDRIDYKLRVHGLPIRWQSLIERWEPNKSFVDTQTKGPYKKWHHTHTFLPVKEGTLVVDEVRYEVPGGSLGSLVLGPFIRSDLKKIFDYRRKVIAEQYSR